MNKIADSPENSSDAEKEKQNVALASLVLEFVNETTCHGLKRAATPKGSKNSLGWKNVAWFLLIGTSFAMAVAGLIEIFDDYFSHPVSTSVDMESHTSLDFPTITICNLNLAIWNRIPEEAQKEFEELKLLQNARKSAGFVSADQDHLQLLITTLRQLNATGKQMTGHILSEMMIECLYGKERCTTDHFRHWYNVQYGNCYSFRCRYGHVVNVTRNYRVKPGAKNGLKLILDVQQDQYLDITEAAGIKVLIHEEGQVPFPEDEGFVVTPGFSTNIGLSQFDIHRVSEPHGICVPREGEHNFRSNMFASDGYSYSTIACAKTCYQIRAMADCSCCDPSYPCNDDLLQVKIGLSKPTMNFSSIHLCNSYDELACIRKLLDEIGQRPVCTKFCPPVCKEVSFDRGFSFSSWPHKEKTEKYFEKIGGTSRFGTITAAAERRAAVQDNVLMLNVYFEHGDVVTIQAQPAYNWNRLLSDIGGQLGLWLGFSLLTAVEIVELFLDGFVHLATTSSSFCFSLIGLGSTPRMST